MLSAGRVAVISIMLAGEAMVAAAFAQSPDDSRIMCKSEATTATRLPQPRVCRTKAQWRALEKERELDRNGEIFAREPVIARPLPMPAAAPR